MLNSENILHRIEIGGFEIRQQETDYDCAGAVLDALIHYYTGRHYGSVALFNQAFEYDVRNNVPSIVDKNKLKSKEEGISHNAIISFAKDYGVECFEHENGTFNLLKFYIDRGMPVIIDFISPRWNESPISKPWIDNGGHYSAIAGYGYKSNGKKKSNDKKELISAVKIADPGWPDHPEFGLYYWMDYYDFEKRWFDLYPKHLKSNGIYDSWMVAFCKKS